MCKAVQKLGYVCDGSTGGSLLCGNGTVDTGETCDDGNAVNADGCSKLCKVEYKRCAASQCARSE